MLGKLVDALLAGRVLIRGKGKTGREMFAPGDQLPAGYENLPFEPYRDHGPTATAGGPWSRPPTSRR